MRCEGGEGLRSRSSVVNWSLHVSINLFLHSFVKGYWEGRGIGLSVTAMFKVCMVGRYDRGEGLNGEGKVGLYRIG